ncbi:hypothetical protein LOKG_00055 [Loktanella phage pCB2051-A]|uniref:Uncharacterized protein n=1 Tax=Loktanella phage pCB2051-A TaxID=754044 RepID=M4QP29_9CAUD|nr:hypothetical protein LOKG_00055 [Loktanella phage pCB2051-A]AGH31491.1 hypothetical protein LOKG_00055 [Loktanella phage pCB2051-A]
MSNWEAHDGVKCPVPAGTKLKMLWQDGVITDGVAKSNLSGMPEGCTPEGGWDWSNEDLINIVIGYLIVSDPDAEVEEVIEKEKVDV